MLGMTYGDETGCWTADGATLRAVRRPDGAWWIGLPEEQPGAWPALVDAATQDGCGTLLISRPLDQGQEHERGLRRAGFTPARAETTWRLPIAAIPTTPVRAQHRIVSVAELDPEIVADLDNAIRADIPGTQGWVGTGAQLKDSLDDPDFDPALYLVAQHPHTGRLDGLVRVWNRHPEPRLGCIGVTSSWRRTGLALALLQAVARTLHARGTTHITAETDDTNRASHLMALNHGGTAVATTIEWQRPSPSRPGAPAAAANNAGA